MKNKVTYQGENFTVSRMRYKYRFHKRHTPRYKHGKNTYWLIHCNISGLYFTAKTEYELLKLYRKYHKMQREDLGK